eukprot:scaffold45441_cov36-Phaeocystis_antarctica.AAC.2
MLPRAELDLPRPRRRLVGRAVGGGGGRGAGPHQQLRVVVLRPGQPAAVDAEQDLLGLAHCRGQLAQLHDSRRHHG